MLRAMNRGRWAWLWCVAWGWCAALAAQDGSPIEARVVRVVDGDSLWVRPASGPPLRLRIQGVDAPEICQPHGPQARDALAARVLQRQVRVTLLRKDGYDRWLVRLHDAQGDVAAWLVAQGHAWTTRWQRQPGPYAQQEAQARGARRGLFAQARPEEPRAFRLRHGPCPVAPVPS